MAEIGAFLSSEEHGPAALVAQAKLARRSRNAFHLHFGSLSPVDRSSGREPVRVECHRRHQCHDVTQGHDGRHLPHGQDSPGDPGPSRSNLAAPARREIRLRGRFGRGSERAHPGPPLASRRHQTRDARGGRRGHPQALGGWAGHPSRPLLHSRERPHLLDARLSAADPCFGLWARGDGCGRPHRRRLRDGAARQGTSGALSEERRKGSRHRRPEGLLGPGRAAGPQAGSRALAHRRQSRANSPRS